MSVINPCARLTRSFLAGGGFPPSGAFPHVNHWNMSCLFTGNEIHFSETEKGAILLQYNNRIVANHKWRNISCCVKRSIMFFAITTLDRDDCIFCGFEIRCDKLVTTILHATPIFFTSVRQAEYLHCQKQLSMIGNVENEKNGDGIKIKEIIDWNYRII